MTAAVRHRRVLVRPGRIAGLLAVARSGWFYREIMTLA
jgi:hypothetical protein